MEFVILIGLATLSLIVWQTIRPHVVHIHIWLVHNDEVIEGEEWKQGTNGEEV